MAKIKWKFPIEEIHGKLKSDFGASQRSSMNGYKERKPFTVFYGSRDTINHPVGAAETAARARFTAVVAMVQARKLNSTKRAQDMAAFAQNQSQYGTYNRYVWAVCGQEYDNAQ